MKNSLNNDGPIYQPQNIVIWLTVTINHAKLIYTDISRIAICALTNKVIMINPARS